MKAMEQVPNYLYCKENLNGNSSSDDDSKREKNIRVDTNTNVQSNALTESNNKKITEVLSSTLIYTTVTYILCILLGIVDIRNTTIMKVLLTILALTSVVVFVRISFLGNKEKNKLS